MRYWANMPIRETYMLWDKPITQSDNVKPPAKVEGSRVVKNIFKAPVPVKPNVCVADKTAVRAGLKSFPPVYTKQGEINMINSLKDEKNKVLVFNDRHPSGNYIIINKKTSSATVYASGGDSINCFEIGTGREIGDNLNNAYGKGGKQCQMTPAGEYSIKKQGGNGYGKFIFNLGSDYNVKGSNTFIALHKIPDHLMSERFPLFANGNVADNRMSAGCINVRLEDFKKLEEQVHVGSKVYILPEDKGNHLKLETQKNGKLRFVQTDHHPRTY